MGGVQIEGIDSPGAAAAAAAAADERVHNYFQTMYLARIICMMTSPALSPFTLREMIGKRVHKLQLYNLFFSPFFTVLFAFCLRHLLSIQGCLFL